MLVKENIVETDVLVIGGGSAGCFAAIRAKQEGVDVILVDKGYVGKSGQTPSANYSAVYIPGRHDLKKLVEQVNCTGEYMNDQEWTKITLMESLARWQDLCSWGLPVFKWDKDKNVFISPATKDDGEIVHKTKWPSLFPQEVYIPRYPIRRFSEFLRGQVVKRGTVIMDRIMITDLIKQDGTIVGAVGVSADSDDLYVFKAKATVMCTGAAGFKGEGIRTYATTGDSDAMAYRVGCVITGKEWTEHHPVRADFPTWPWSALDRDRTKSTGKNSPMVTVNAEEQTVGDHWSPSNSNLLEVFEAHAGRAPTYWENINNPEFQMARSPKELPRQEIDEKAQKTNKVRVVQGRSFGQSVHVGAGVLPVDTMCATQVPGLYAAGDSLGACAGGSVYPGQGFAITFCAVTGARAGVGAAEYAKQTKKIAIDKKELTRMQEITCAPLDRKGGFTPTWVTQVFQNMFMPYWVLYIKHEDRLQAALTQLDFMRDNIVPKLTARDSHELRLAHEVRNMVLNAEMKLRASLFRKESRGSHIREDYPRRDDPEWLAWVRIKEENGGMNVYKEPIPGKWWPDLSEPYEKRYPVPFPLENRK